MSESVFFKIFRHSEEIQRAKKTQEEKSPKCGARSEYFSCLRRKTWMNAIKEAIA
jgi:hypothetical protein